MANQKPLIISTAGQIQRLPSADLIDPVALGTGSASGSTYLRGDGTWATLGASAIQKYTATIGDGTNVSYTITHNLNTAAITVSVREISSGYFVYPDVKYTSDDAIVLEFAVAPTTDQYYVTVIS